VLFNAQVTNVSFQFDNYGSGSGSYVQAFNGATLVETDSVDSLQGAWFSLTTTSAITELQFNNNTGGDSSWLFDVNSITANVPEPSSLLLALISVAGLTVSRRRRH
ncbi:MAG: PEP-CTERM sorting domain-containing protein, partial [Paucibacter sp.]|nr:PEP-CTERM sorting domain-containing protein [Roseateles sp.]